MLATYTAKGYAPEHVRTRYVKYRSGILYQFCERGDDLRWDIRQGAVTENELPPEVAAAARASAGVWPSYVEWPL